jgi:L-alanine-DL-glutamate epimerase-like enolase superfamily enzyme
MLEQPTPADDLEALYQVTKRSPVPVLADESVSEPPSALEVAKRHAAHGMSVKLTACGGLRCARQIDTIARIAQMSTMVSCVNQPALLTAAGLSFALSSPNVVYADLDGHFDIIGDPTQSTFRLEEGSLVATDVPGLGCTVNLA